MAKQCLRTYVGYYKSAVLSLDDDAVRRNIADKPNWYQSEYPNHRLWLRLLLQEAHKRGLKV